MVVGIAPQDVGFSTDVDIWLPLAPDPAVYSRGDRRLLVLGRLAPGVTPARATAEMEAIAAALAREFPDSNEGWGALAKPVRDWIVAPELRARLLVLLASLASAARRLRPRADRTGPRTRGRGRSAAPALGAYRAAWCAPDSESLLPPPAARSARSLAAPLRGGCAAASIPRLLRHAAGRGRRASRSRLTPSPSAFSPAPAVARLLAPSARCRSASTRGAPGASLVVSHLAWLRSVVAASSSPRLSPLQDVALASTQPAVTRALLPLGDTRPTRGPS